MVKIAVVGDIMLDTYHFGTWKEATGEIPTIMIKNTKYYLGGASATANNIKNLGCNIRLFGYIGNDSNGDIIKRMLERKKIERVIHISFEQTIHKTRINQIIRFDEETIRNIDCKVLYQSIKKYNPDIIVIVDFAKGTINQEFVNKIMKLKKIVLVDPKKLNYKGAYLIKPNLSEAINMTHETEEKKIIKKLKKIYKNILLTKGKDGMSLYEHKKDVFNIPTEAKEMYDTTGAGDTAMAVIAVCLAEGKSLREASIFGNKAAGIVVEHIGQYDLTREELKL